MAIITVRVDSLFTILLTTILIELIYPQPVDQFSQTKLHSKAQNDGYSHIYRMYKSDNRLLKYQTISNYKFHWLLFQKN